MTNVQKINDVARILAQSICLPTEHVNETDTGHAFSKLALKSNWQVDDISAVDFFSKKLDINDTLHCSYDETGNITNGTPISNPKLWELVFTILYKAFQLDVMHDGSKSIRLKRFNTLLKAADHVASPSSAVAELQNNLDALLACEIDGLPDNKSAVFTEASRSELFAPDTVTKLPMTVLFHEGPIARAYLEALHHLGFRLDKIIHLVSSRDLASGKPIGRWLPKGLRCDYAASIQKSRIHHWPKRLAAQHSAMVGAFNKGVESQFGFPNSVIADASALHNLSRYSDDVESIIVEHLADDNLHDYLSSLPESVFLYTGGGIVPAKILNIPRHRFIHVHPGYLPDIRGADCVLWSSLLRGRLSASCFYMAPGIDVGDIILSCWLPNFKIRCSADGVDILLLYRTVFSYLDPWVRAYTLRKVIEKHQIFIDIPTHAQRIEDGTTFHFMHPKLQAEAITTIVSR